jgi:hypothetical protein
MDKKYDKLECKKKVGIDRKIECGVSVAHVCAEYGHMDIWI